MDAARRERRHHRKAAAAGGGGGVVGAPNGGGGGAAAAAAAARAAYGDVFGGPPRFAAPFGGAPLDYAEVFGGVTATCTIPYLDLPPAAAVGVDGGFFACRGKGDYGEIFGRFDFGDFALPYEDLFGEPGPEAEEREPEITSPSSGSSRFVTFASSSSFLSLQHSRVFRESSAFSTLIRVNVKWGCSYDTENQQFVMSYNKTTERKPDDRIEMTTCTVEPSMDFVIDSRNMSHGPATNHVSRIDNDTIASDDNDRNPSSASVSARSPENDFLADQKQQSPSWTPISGSVSANENHKNYDSHSTRNTVTPDYAFLQVSDIDAQAQSIKVQPLLRQQPKLLNKKESAAKESINLVNHCHTPTSVAHTTSSSNIPHADKKADVNPTSASAAVAMKEAMDFAEARLKAAKELLERKGDSFKLQKKSSHHRSSRSTEIKAPVCVEEDTSKQKLSVKKSSEEEKNPDGSLSDKHTKLSAVRFDHSDGNGKRELPLEKPQQMMPHSAESCQTSNLREGKTAPVDKDRVSVILEASTENMAPQKTHNSVGIKASCDTECLELPSVSDASAKLDVLKDMPDSLPEACSSGNACDLRDCGDSIPKVSPVAGASQDSKLELEVPCSGGMQCASGGNEKLQEPSDANVIFSREVISKSLILEELQESDVCDAFVRPRLSRIDQQAETYGRENSVLLMGSLLHNKGDEGIIKAASDSSSRATINLKDDPAFLFRNRAKKRENMTRVDSATDKDKASSRKAQETEENEKRLEKQRELAEEKERQKLEEERERERKKDRLAVERATREAHERAFAEAREKAEKMALERITAARQRASAEAREKEERASAEAAAERATREARIKAERAAVERATAEARERAIEKAKAEKALAEARERRERYRSSFKEGLKSNQSKALAEKNRRDMLAQREQAEKHRLSEFLDPEIKRWSNGKEGNLRALLSTLQYLTGRQRSVSIQIKYNREVLQSDRNTYVRRFFDLLKDAWNKFTSEER
ncbi:hypothetical protein HU200_026373 [Digitaria exilis]|uniref:Uncharacterized protein n=1 Tax=Digitaria exilis TaxID=1010633 RepID=A0A835BY23_9POAL|nr:hypothetical protein HU200_026373 [Digitaria exilis]